MMKSKHSSKKGIGGKPHRDHGKPSYGNGKAKESKNKAPDSPEECALSFPDLRTIDKNQLQTYCQVLNRNKEECIGMEDLDRLQLELEMLLTGVAVRLRDLNNEIATLNIAEERRDKKIKLALTTSRKKADDKKHRDLTGKSRPRIGTLDDPSVLGSDVFGSTSLDSSKMLITKNDIPHKFWLSVEPYCSEISAEDIKFLKELKANCEKETEIQKIPPLGRHYTLRWAEEDMMDERDGSAVIKLKRKPSEDVKDMLKKASKIVIRERIPGPLVQRLVSALVEENYISPLQESILANKLNKITSGNETNEPLSKKIKTEDPNSPSENKSSEHPVPNYIKKLPTYHTSACFELRIRRELEASGFIDPQDYKEDNDEILSEIKKCQEELRATALHTVEQLKRLIKLAEVELDKSEVRKKLKMIEQEIVETSRRIVLAKQKKLPIAEKEKENAWKLLNERKTLLKSLESIH